jgi:hypothetical protein
MIRDHLDFDLRLTCFQSCTLVQCYICYNVFAMKVASPCSGNGQSGMSVDW